MIGFGNRQRLLAGAALAATALLSACATPAPPPPPPPPQVVIPPRPYPPLGAATNLATPPVGINGIRLTVNVGLTTAQTVWNLRSAYNVAALNCLKPEHAAILENYRAFLKTHSKALNTANKDLDKQYKELAGSEFVRVRETYMTRVYNYFALPPTLPAFCDAALAMSEQAKAIPPGGLDSFAAASLPQLESVFTQFFNSYDQYRSDLSAWEARYGGGAAPALQTITYQSFSQPTEQ